MNTRAIICVISLTYTLLSCDTTPDVPTVYRTNISWTAVSSTNQLVTESLSEEICPSGWTMLFSQLKESGESASVPLQEQYVKRFRSLGKFSQAAKKAFSLIGEKIPTLRLSLSWPCFGNITWRNSIVDTVQNLQEAGFVIELTLSHHDSYPASLHKPGGSAQIARSGWANPEAKNTYIAYVSDVIRLFKPILPTGTRVYLINEPIAMLFNSYLGNGNWPPGGKRAIAGLYSAMINLRDAVHEGGKLIQEAQWEPAVAKNIRVKKEEDTLDPILDYVFNWWLLDALVNSCIDNFFSRECSEYYSQTIPFTVGITYYGTMQNKEEAVLIKPTPTLFLQMPLPEMDFSPSSRYFSRAIFSTAKRYKNSLITIAEIGLSSGDTQKTKEWLLSYSKIVQENHAKNLEKNIGIHTLFESAEFSAGEWFFHILDGCDTNAPCVFTPWGNALVNHIDSL